MFEIDGVVNHLWAKTDHDDPTRWHPLGNHLIDVASVALEMWCATLPAAACTRWTSWFGGNGETAGRWLALLAGLHDLGKASPVFQGASNQQRARLAGAGIFLRPQPRHPIRHGTITAGTLPSLLRERWPGLHGAAARRYAVVSGIHHGSLIDATSLRNATPQRNPDQIGSDDWDDARHDLFDLLLAAIADVPQLPGASLPYPLATWAAGFISVADWIGSNTTYFPFATPITNPTQAFRDARAQARAALTDLGWLHGTVNVPVAFDAAFPGLAPNATQQATIDAVQSMNGPGLVIIETPMGEGKTEAAFWTAAWAHHHWGTRGCYVAMPTRASSDQLFDRLVRHLTDHTAQDEQINLLLLHGHAAISAQLQQIQRDTLRSAPEPVASPDEPADVLLRAEWFSPRRRGLLAPYGVGTVDQTLLSILENRHYFVRLHGLAGKILIFDEVHAYDTYMETLLSGELEGLGALGTPVVMLSATLPGERRDALLKAYARGAGWEQGDASISAPYPRVSTVDQDAIRSVGIVPSERQRHVAVRWFTGREGAARAEMTEALTKELCDGGTCAVICNTVGQAQAMYRVLEAQFPGEVDLLHARFRYMDRARRQDRILESFGKHPESRPNRRIVVATQVIEQSLDLDFDLMVSYFCPTDLLIQRLGRMHRHTSNDPGRPAALKWPQLWVLGVGETDDPNYAGLGVPVASRYVYDPHVLLRSWAVLRYRDHLTLPDDIEICIEQTYRPDVAPPADLADAWRKSEAVSRKTVAEETRQAMSIMVPAFSRDGVDSGADPLIRSVGEKTPQEEQQQDLDASAIARTRLGPASVDIILLTPDEYEQLDPVAGNGQQPLAMPKVAELLVRSVSISQRGIYNTLVASEPPSAWRRTIWLRRHRLVVLDHHHQAPVGKYTVTLSPTLGVVIQRSGEEGDADRVSSNVQSD